VAVKPVTDQTLTGRHDSRAAGFDEGFMLWQTWKHDHSEG
jgi:hypothetical protein